MLCCRHCGAELKSDKEAGRDGAIIYVYVCGCFESLKELKRQTVGKEKEV